MSVTRREFVKTAAVVAGSASVARTAYGLHPPNESFSTGGHTVYHLRPAKVTQDQLPVAICACYDGMVLCYTAEGKQLWAAPTGGYFPFDLGVADIDGGEEGNSIVAHFVLHDGPRQQGTHSCRR